MKKIFLLSIAFFLVIQSSKPFTENEVKVMLKQMAEADQELRKRILDDVHETKRSLDEVLHEYGLPKLDTDNTNKLKEIVTLHGWPTLSKFGQEACMNAWLLVQHSQDLNFQKECLALMKHLPSNEIEKRWIVYLYDRIRTHHNQPFTEDEVKMMLKQMAEADQELRKRILDGVNETNCSWWWPGNGIPELDAHTTNRLKEIVICYGWPTVSKFGKEACQNAWLLVQHSQDLNFQKECLELMKQLPDHEIEKRLVVDLCDRIQNHNN